MTATVLKIRSSTVRLRCSVCGLSAEAPCDCGAIYVPAGALAAAAIAANPKKSDRAIAGEIGVGKDTVRRERKSTGAFAPVAKRTGKDGKTRRLPTRKPQPGAKTAPNITVSVSEMVDRAINSTLACTEPLRALIDTGPKLSDEAVTDLVNALDLCSEEYQRTARILEKRFQNRGEPNLIRPEG